MRMTQNEEADQHEKWVSANGIYTCSKRVQMRELGVHWDQDSARERAKK